MVVEVLFMGDITQLDPATSVSTTEFPLANPGISFTLPRHILEGYHHKQPWMQVDSGDWSSQRNEIKVTIIGLDDEARVREALVRVQTPYAGSQSNGLENTRFMIAANHRSMQDNPKFSRAIRDDFLQSQVERLSNPDELLRSKLRSIPSGKFFCEPFMSDGHRTILVQE